MLFISLLVLFTQSASGFLYGISTCSSCYCAMPCCQVRSCVTTTVRSCCQSCGGCCGSSFCSTTQITTSCSGCGCGGCRTVNEGCGGGGGSTQIIPSNNGIGGGCSGGNALPSPNFAFGNNGGLNNINPPAGAIIAYPIQPMAPSPLTLPQLPKLSYAISPSTDISSLGISSLNKENLQQTFPSPATGTGISGISAGSTSEVPSQSLMPNSTSVTAAAPLSITTNIIPTSAKVNAENNSDLEVKEGNTNGNFGGNQRTTGIESVLTTTLPTKTDGKNRFTVFDDIYDDDLNFLSSRNLLAADVSSEFRHDKPQTDIYEKRYRYFNKLKNRLFRQLSAPSVADETISTENTRNSEKSSGLCNSYKLARIMVKAMVSDVSISKRLIRKATEISFNGRKFDVFCASGDFSYSIYSEQYCEATRGNVTCFAFS